MSTERTFTIDSSEVGVVGGRFSSKTPGSAAAKAGRKLFAEDTKKKAIRFTLRETTLGSAKKSYTYIATKEKLDSPRTIERGEVKLTITHVYRIKSCRV